MVRCRLDLASRAAHWLNEGIRRWVRCVINSVAVTLHHSTRHVSISIDDWLYNHHGKKWAARPSLSAGYDGWLWTHRLEQQAIRIYFYIGSAYLTLEIAERRGHIILCSMHSARVVDSNRHQIVQWQVPLVNRPEIKRSEPFSSRSRSEINGAPPYVWDWTDMQKSDGTARIDEYSNEENVQVVKFHAQERSWQACLFFSSFTVRPLFIC